MQPRIPILAQSENKSKFLRRLGISDQTEEGKRIYTMMKEEAVAGRARMSADSSSLLPQHANNPDVRPPYSNTQISESAMHRETLNIYRNARPETRVYYEGGHYTEGDTEENWIIKWLLWHVFRYRDNRNRGRGNQQHSSSSQPSQGPESPNSITSNSTEAQASAGPSASTPSSYPPSTYPPPVQAHVSQPTYHGTRNASENRPERARSDGQHVQHFPSAGRPNSLTTSASNESSRSQGYWDPVREAHRSESR